MLNTGKSPPSPIHPRDVAIPIHQPLDARRIASRTRQGGKIIYMSHQTIGTIVAAIIVGCIGGPLFILAMWRLFGQE